MARTWSVKAVYDTAASTVVTLDDATVLQIEDALSSPGGSSIEVPLQSADVDELVTPDLSTLREYQLWCSDTDDLDYLVAWHRITQPRADGRVMRIQGAGLLSYFGRRHVGRAERTNMVVNGGMETATAGAPSSWTAIGGVTATRSSARRMVGTYSARLEQSTVAADAYVAQTFESPGYAVGIEWTASAWVWIDPAAWVNSAFGRRGLYMQIGTGISTDIAYAPIGRDTPRGTWVRLETALWLPPSVSPSTVQVRLYAPAGVVYWDAVSVVAQESWASVDDDVTDVLHGLALHAQDVTLGKSDLGIGVAGDPTGRTITRVWPFAEHAQILSAMREVVDADGTADISVQCTATTRTFTVHPAGRTGTLTLPVDASTITGIDWAADIERGASSVVMLGRSYGAARDEAGAVDTLAFGGVTLEHVAAAPLDATVDSLAGRADALLSTLVRPITASITVGGDAWVSAIVRGEATVGMTVTVTATWDGFALNGPYRIVAWRLDPVRQLVTLDLQAVP